MLLVDNSEDTKSADSCQLDVVIFTKLVSEANVCEHWTKKRKRVKGQQSLVKFLLSEQKPVGSIELPCQVTLTRYCMRKYDDDNLVSAFKHIRDQVANYLKPGLAPGQADNDDKISWVYRQVNKTKNRGLIRIQIHS